MTVDIVYNYDVVELAITYYVYDSTQCIIQVSRVIVWPC